MPGERVPMRCVREILRLKYGCGATDRMIARSTGTESLQTRRWSKPDSNRRYRRQR